MPLAVITGASLGLGFQTARGLLATGYEVLITSRDRGRAKSATSRLLNEFPKGTVSSLQLDLSSASSIEAFTPAFKTRFDTWDVLVNNAGAKVLLDYTETDSGVEYHFGANAVGHFALTADLMKHRAPISRVVSVSSIVARWASASLGPLGSESNYSRGQSYGASKLSNLLFALELDRRFGSSEFSSVAAHPGFARAEPYGPASTRFLESLLAQSAERGALPIVEAASNALVSGGSYRVPKLFELWGKPKEGRMAKSCTLENQERNWTILESLSGRKLVI